jgi:poly(ADP-ribose) glycohydrolase ARH3
MDRDRLRSRFIGSLLGCAIGDGLGVYSFHRSRKQLLELQPDERLTYTDDTAMAIGIAESLSLHERIDEKLLGDRLQTNYKREPNRGYANGPIKVFEMVEQQGIPYSKAAQMLFGWQGSLGNGGAMRAGPIGLFYYDSADIYEHAKVSSIVTHAHPVGVDGAALIAIAVAEALRIDPVTNFDREQFLSQLLIAAKTKELQAKLRTVSALLKHGTSDKNVAEDLGRSVRADESVPFALYSFLRYPMRFDECILCAVCNGGDRDTLGAMTGSIVGAFLGVESIPNQWKVNLENRDYLEKLAQLLLHKRVQQAE